MQLSDRQGSTASFNTPRGTAVNSNGVIYVADSAFSRIRKITQAGMVSTVAGDGSPANADGIFSLEKLNKPYDLVVAPIETVFVADTVNTRKRRIQNSL